MEHHSPSGIERVELRRSSRPHRRSQKLLDSEEDPSFFSSLLDGRVLQKSLSVTPKASGNRLLPAQDANRMLAACDSLFTNGLLAAPIEYRSSH
jgi:hypothetical protein